MKDLPPRFGRFSRVHRTFSPLVLALFLLAGCQGNEPSQLEAVNADAYTPPTAQSPEDQTQAIGDTLGLPQAKPSQNEAGEVVLQVQTEPLIYSDGGLPVNLEGQVTLAGEAKLSQTLWRQTAGPQAQLLNPTQAQAQVILPLTTTITDLEFALLAADTEGHVAEARTRIRVLPLAAPALATEAIAAHEPGRVTVSLSLPTPPEAPVTLFYSTQDGTALAGRDYTATQGQVTLGGANPQAQVEIPLTSAGEVNADNYFRFQYAPTADRAEGQFLYVVLPKDRTSAPDQPVDKPPEPEPADPMEPPPTEPVEPTAPNTPVDSAPYNVTYTASEGGRIEGEAEQTLDADQNGSPVTAIADPGYYFATWSDGQTTATRTASALQAPMQVTAKFRLAELWMASGHHGHLSANAGYNVATIDWPAEPGESYNLIVTHDPTTELQNYSVYGAQLHTNVTPPLTLTNLTPDQPMYIALQQGEALQAWSSFVPRALGAENPVSAIAVAEDGTRYIGGDFIYVGPDTGSGAALTADPQRPAHVLTGADVRGGGNNGGIYASVADGYGGWYIGGTFTMVNGEERMRLAHITAEGQLSPWNPGADGWVITLAIDQDVIYAGGHFNQAGGENRERLAAFNREGQLLPWNPGADAHIRSLAIEQGTIYAGGSFTQAGGEPRSYLAAFDSDGQLLPWNPGTNSDVFTLATGEGIVYVGGGFTQAGGENRSYLAAFDGNEQLSPWNPGTSGTVYALAIDQGIVYVGGLFTQAAGESRSYLAAFDSDGQLLPWNPGADDWIRTLAINQGVVYAGGEFEQAGGESRRHLAAFDSDGQLLPWNPGAATSKSKEFSRPWVNTLSIDQGVIYAGGGFTQIGGESRSRLAAFNSDGQLLPWKPETSGRVYALATHQGVIYAGGSFILADGERSSHLAAFDRNGQLLPWQPEVDGGSVSALAIDQGILYVGGGFTHAGGERRRSLAAFDDSGQLLPWNPEAIGSVITLAINQDIIYAGGFFEQAGGESRSRLAAFDTNGQLLPWNPVAEGGSVDTIAIDRGVIYAGGEFTQAGGENRSHLAAFDSNGALLSWNPGTDYSVRALAIEQGVIYAGGQFKQAGGESRSRLAAFGSDGQVLPWNPGANKSSDSYGAVSTLVIEQGIIHAGGYFRQLGGKSLSHLAAFDIDGATVVAESEGE